MTPDELEFLLSEAGCALLEQLAQEDLSEARTLPLLTQLRRTYTPTQAGAALETARLRLKAVDKFGADAAQMLFTRDALEQASDPRIRAYRAANIAGQVLDVCCGIGSDALAFAAAGASVLGLDIDPLRIKIAQYNATVLGLNARFETADVRAGLPSGYDLIFFDPARRDQNGKRIFDVEQYIPPLSIINQWQAPRLMVKLSPGVDLTQLEPYSGQIEFVSVDGDLKEAVLHLPENQAPFATLITTEDIYHWRRDAEPDGHRLAEPLGWFCEPDPALIRAGLVQDAAAAFNGYQLDETIAYFTCETLPESPWVKSWRIHDWMPFHIKRLRAYLREHHIGRVTVKKRGSPLTPEALIAQLKLKGGSAACTLVLTRFKGNPIVVICEEHPTHA